MSNQTAPGKPDDGEASLPALSPDDVTIQNSSDPETDDYRTLVFQLMTPRTRGAIVDALLQAGDNELTAQQLADSHSGFTVNSFNNHRDTLLDFGVLVKTGQQGNATTYRLNTEHPVVALLGMINQVYTNGTSPLLLDDQYVRDADLDTAE